MSAFSAFLGGSRNLRRTSPWVLIVVLVMVTSGAGLVGPAASHALAPVSAVHTHPGGGSSPFAWTQLSITSLDASPSTTYLGSPTTISASATGGNPPYTYNYSYSGTALTGAGCQPDDDVTSSTYVSFDCTPSATGSFSLILTLTDSLVAGQMYPNRTQDQVSLDVLPLTLTSFWVSPTPSDLGADVYFMSSVEGAAGPVTYTWTGLPTNCTAPANDGNLTCVPSTSGTWTVTLNATDTSGASSVASTDLTVTPVQVAYVSADPNPIYTGQWTNLSTYVYGVTGAVSYSYSGLPPYSPDCVSQDLATLPCLPRVAGDFWVTVTATDSAGDTSSGTAYLSVRSATVESLDVSPLPTYQGQATTIETTSYGFFGAPSFVYDGLAGSGCVPQNASMFVCVPTVRGTYNVSVTVSDWTGNQSTSAVVTMNVDPVAQPGFYVSVNTTFSDQPIFADKALGVYNQLCYPTNNSPFYSSTCYSQSVDPTILNLSGGVTGVGYSTLTVNTSSTCPGASGNTNSLVVFALSDTNGATFYHRTWIGNFASCAYLNAIEPSFAVNDAGTIFGVFIEENSSQGTLPAAYGARVGDALAFVVSTDGGLTFSAPIAIDASGGLALPQVAVHGQSVYVVYEEIANGTTLSSGSPAIAVRYVYSTNGGTSFSSPRTLPGLGKSEGWNAMSPSIAVSSLGSVAVAYATNRACLVPSGSACFRFGEDLVVVVSTTNGTSWTGPSTVSAATGLGETTCYAGPCQRYFYQSTPQTAIAYSEDGGRLLVAWAGAVNLSGGIPPSQSNQWYRWTAVGMAQSANGGATWTGGLVPWAHPEIGPTSPILNTTNYYRPAIGVRGAMVYLTFSVDNETAPYVYYSGPFDNTYSQWVTNASIDPGSTSLAWWRATPINYLEIPYGRYTNFTRNSFTGYHSAIGFSGTGSPLVGYSMVQLPITTTVTWTGYYAVNSTYPTNLTIAAPARYGMPGVVNVSFQEFGLPTGTPWQFLLDNQVVTASDTSSLLLTNVPMGVPVFPEMVPYTAGYGYQVTQGWNLGWIAEFYYPSTVTLSYTVLVQYAQFFAPQIPPPASCSGYCDMYQSANYYTYQCLPGGTCDPNSLGYCGYYYWETNCFYLDWWMSFDQYGYGSGQFYSYYDSYVYFSGYDASGSYVSFNCYYWGTGPNTCFPYLPIGFKLAGNMRTSSYGWGITLPDYATYANGTGSGSFNGPTEGNQLGSGVWGACGSDVWGDCEALYYNEYWDAPTCYSWNTQYCNYAPILLNGPVNETLWTLPTSYTPGSGPTYPEEVLPSGLPTGTQYSFAFDGVTHTARSPNPVILKDVALGPHSITGGQAASTQPGWYYYASPVTVQVPQQPIVNLTFVTLVDVGAASRSVTFHALNVSTGSLWRLSFNGSTYSASTPNLTLSAKPGNYSVASWPLVSATGDSAYVPNFPKMVSLIAATSADLSFVPSYKVSVAATVGGTVSLGTTRSVTSAEGWYASGAQVAIDASAQPGYTFLGWFGRGSGSYSGTTATTTLTVRGPIAESANFYALPATRYNLTFMPGGLPAGTWWTVYLNGVGYSTNASLLTVPNLYPYSAGALGRYTLTLGISYLNTTTNSTRFVGTGPSWVSTNGSSSVVALLFQPQFLINVQATPGGSVEVTSGNLVITSEPFWARTGTTVTIDARPAGATANGRWVFLGWNGTGPDSYTGTSAQATIAVDGPVTEIASFEFHATPPPNRFTLTVQLQTPIAAGTSWTVTVGPQTFSSTAPTLLATGLLPANYKFALNPAISPDGSARYLPVVGTPTAVPVLGNASLKVSFQTQYWVSIQAMGGGTVSATGPTGAPVPLVGWFASGTSIILTATPTGDNWFTFWNGTGMGAYTGNSAVHNFTVGGPITEVAGFIPPEPGATVQGGVFASTPSWIAFAAVGLGVGIGLAVLLGRRWTGPGGRAGSPEPETTSAPSEEPSAEVPEAPAEEAVPEFVEDQGGAP